MKSEIEVFIANVFLPVLESPNCPFERKSLVLEALRALCVDPMILTSIFLNYDCDFDAVNLYKTIVYHLTSLSVRGRTSAPTPTAKAKPASEKFSLSVAGLEVLVVILQGFLKALDLPGGDDIPNEERSKVRGSLQLDVGMAVKSEMDKSIRKPRQVAEEVTVTAEELKNMENATSEPEDVAGKIVDAFDKKRAAQQQFELGLVKFKLSAKQGLLFFIKNGIVQMDAKMIASFFNEHKELLDKTQIGEIFGREPEASFVKGEGIDPEKGGVGFYIRVLHHYVDGLDFTGLKFDDAIRLFLSGFRLPGESQKVSIRTLKIHFRFERRHSF
jgi:brefeldin A-inhibited guanine nucleotide-exchange protein